MYMHPRPPLRTSDDTIFQAMSDMSALASLVSARPELFVLRSQLTGCHGVIFHFDDTSAQTLTRHLAPSYFVDWPDALNRQCLPQVHIPDSRIGSLANCHLVSFYQAPDISQIEATRDVLGRHLGDEHSRALHTTSFKHDASFPTFEIDGSLGRPALDRILSPLVKSALSSYAKGTIRRDVNLESTGQPSRSPVTIVVWARQSEDDTSAATSISRQVWSSLTSGPPVMTGLHPEDRVLIVVEYCSSSSHPWSDRQIRKLLPFDRPLHVVTANPDRLTRRADEVIPILREITRTGGSWWTQGLQSHDISPGTWIDVSDNPLVVQEHARCSRQRALQLGFYNRTVTTMTRCIMTSENQPNCEQLTALKGFMRFAMETHRIKCVVIFIRDSPPRGEERREARSVSTSLARQDQFLRGLLPEDDVLEVRHVTLSHTSAYDGADVATSLRQSLQCCSGRALVLSTGLDRIVRSKAAYSSVSRLLKLAGHMAVSLLWDPQTRCEPTTAMALPSES